MEAVGDDFPGGPAQRLGRFARGRVADQMPRPLALNQCHARVGGAVVFIEAAVSSRVLDDPLHATPAVREKIGVVEQLAVGKAAVEELPAEQFDGFSDLLSADFRQVLHRTVRLPLFTLAQHADADVGAIEVGRYGDLVAVRGDPLANVTLLQDIDVVIKGGEVIRDDRK